MLDAYIYDGLRSPFGRHAGSLAPVRPDELVAEVMRAVVARNPWKAEQIEDVILGDTNQAGEDARNVARNALLAAGLPATIGARSPNAKVSKEHGAHAMTETGDNVAKSSASRASRQTPLRWVRR